MNLKDIIENLPKTFYRVSIKALIWDKNHEKFAVILENNGYWELPGGGMDFPERPEECLSREIKEEMNLVITNIAKHPSHVLIGENMKGVKSINLVYEIELKNLDFTPSDECLEIKFISPTDVNSINAFRNVKDLAAMLLAQK